MALQHTAYVLALCVGIASSGLIGSAWNLATEEDVRLGDLLDPDPDFSTPFRALAAVFSAPHKILLDGFGWLIEQPIIGLPILMAGLVWSFLQGVFILTTVLGFP